MHGMLPSSSYKLLLFKRFNSFTNLQHSDVQFTLRIVEDVLRAQ